MTPAYAVRPGLPADADAIRTLYLAGSGRPLDPGRLAGHLTSLPSAVAHAGGELAGFAFCTPFAPDVVELGNLFVAAAHRGGGVGAALVRAVERLAAPRFHTLVVVNSMLYVGVPDKRPAAPFYHRLGYDRIWTTGPTDVFARRLSAADATGDAGPDAGAAG
jgi:GNAT superfamily N-acetyltransferase